MERCAVPAVAGPVRVRNGEWGAGSRARRRAAPQTAACCSGGDRARRGAPAITGEGRRSRADREQGFALILVLWVVTLLAIVIVSFAHEVGTQTRLERNQYDRARAQAL